MNVVVPLAPLLAIDLESLLPFLFVIYWIASQLFGAFRRGRQAPGPMPRQPRVEREPRPAPAAGDPRGDIAGQQGDIARQIEEFLRQAGGEPPRTVPQRPAGMPAEAGRSGPSARPTPAARPSAPAPQRPVAPGRPTTLSPRERDEALRPRQGEIEPRRSDTRRPRTGSGGPPAARPSGKAATKPRATTAAPPSRTPPALTPLDGGPSVERHVSEAFGKELPHLAAGPAGGPAPAAATPSLADDLVRKLRDPASIRELILLREVLDRPVGRW